MHKSFYKLDCEPFNLQPDLKFLWMGEKYKEALAVLRYAILDNKGFLLLTGEAGIGKTILLRALTESLAPEILWAILPNPDAPKMEMFNIIAKGLGMTQKYNSKIEFMLDFSTFLQERHREGKKVLLLVDSAHLLNQENLEELRLLSNIEEANAKLIHIFFTAQPSFGDVLNLPRNSAIRQRLNLAHAIEPLTLQETTAYIQHRLRVAGVENPILTEKAIRSVHRFSGGIPKKINLICQQVLIEGAQRGQKTIDQGTVQECMQKFARSSPNNANRMDIPSGAMPTRDSEGERFNLKRMFVPGIGVLALLAIVAYAGYSLWSQSNQNVQPTPQTSTAGAVPPSTNATASPGVTQQTTPPAPAAETTQPQANPPAPTVAATPPANSAGGTAPTAVPPTTPTVNPAGNSGAQQEATAAMVSISPATGLATVRPAAGTTEQNQTAQTAPAIASAPTPSSAATAGDQQQAASNGDETIIDPHQKEAPAVQTQTTPEQNEAPPQASVNTSSPASSNPLPQLKAALPLRANSLELTSEGNALLAGFVDKFKKAGHGKIEVRGYASSNTNSKENIQISLRRAEAVHAMLIRAGIKPALIVVRAMGVEDPLASNDTSAGREKNRRVEVEMVP